MRTITFDTKVRDGIIEIPKRYKNLNTRQIEVILLVREPVQPVPADALPPKNKARGILRKYKAPHLIPKEKNAWEMAVKEKYGHR